MYYFGANSNNFVGTLPASWSTWTNIHDFNLHDNQLTGTLPSSWGTNWSTVSTIDLNRNYLLGTVPTSWTTMSAITRLDLSFNCLDNNISGPVGSFIDTKYGGPEWRDYQNQCSTSMPTPPHADCSAADVPQQECQALVDLYASTNGASWTHHDGWNTDNTLCDRY